VSHNDILKKSGTTTQATVSRILKVWASASDSDREDGAQWYPLHRQIIIQLSRDWYVSEETAAAVVAHLSPRIHWERCLLAAPVVLSGRRPVGIVGQFYEGALRAVQSDDPVSTLTGPKTSAFVRNLLGDLDAVTCDVWAFKIALGDRDDLNKVTARTGVYDAVAHCYTLAAARVGVSPSTMQAATWCAIRGRSSLDTSA
jgi:hypothetical protein